MRMVAQSGRFGTVALKLSLGLNHEQNYRAYVVALGALLLGPSQLLPLNEPALADHGEPHEPDIIVIGVRPSCPAGAICLTGDAAREFARQLAELAAQELAIQLAQELPSAPTDGELQWDCSPLLAEFKELHDECMADADIAWGR